MSFMLMGKGISMYVERSIASLSRPQRAVTTPKSQGKHASRPLKSKTYVVR